MKKLIFIFAFLLLPLSFAWAQTCTYYASPTGAGNHNGLTQANAMLISEFWNVANLPGKVLCLMDGTYTGANSMINPPGGKNGTALNHITVRALNDGGAFIDGQNVNIPLYLSGGNSYLDFSGFDAANSRAAVIRVEGSSTPSDHINLRRICAWNAYGGAFVGDTEGNADVFALSYGNNFLLEDYCGFGEGRKIVANYKTNTVTVRRGWGMWNHNLAFNADNGSPKTAANGAYEAYHSTWENIISTWDGAAGGDVSYVSGIDGWNISDGQPGNGWCLDANYYGSINYSKTGQTVAPMLGSFYGARSTSCATIHDMVFNAGPFTAGAASTFHYGIAVADAFDGGDGTKTCASIGGCGPRTFDHITIIGTAASGSIDGINRGASGWTVTNNVSGATVAAVPNIWTNTGAGARVCYQYQDGKLLTGTPLWPWPMDARIRQALTRSGRNPANVFQGTAGTGYAANTVTSQMVTLFGAIPAGCMTGASTVITVTITDPAKDGMVVDASQNSYLMLGTSNLP